MSGLEGVHPVPSGVVRRWRAIIRHGAALTLYLGLALLMTWPMALQVAAAVPGNGFDTWQNMWNMWWLRQALLTGANPYFTPYLYYPHGASLLLHTLNPINFLISLPVHALFGLVVAYNFVVLFSLTMSGYTAYLLARSVLAEQGDGPPFEGRAVQTGRPDVGDERDSGGSQAVQGAALAAGAVFATSGYLLAQVLGSHTHMLAAWPLPLAVLALRRAVAAPGWRRVVPAGALIALTVLCDWQYLLFTLIWAAWYALATLAAPRLVTPLLQSGDPQRERRAGWLGFLAVAAAIGLALLLVMPLAIPTARFAQQIPTAATEGGPAFRLEHSADLADFFIPSQLHPLWGRLAEYLQAYKAETHIQNKTVYLGIVTLILAALGRRTRGWGFWMLSAALFALLAMGPQLQVMGRLTGIPLPGALIYELPLIGISRYPLRFVVYTMIALAIMAAMGAQRLLVSMRRAGRPAWVINLVLAGLTLLITLDNLTLPFPMVRVFIPSFYADLGRDPERYAILEAPFYYTTSPIYMLYQVVHEKYLVGGYTSRTLPYPLIEQIPTVRMFAYVRPAPDIIAQAPTEIAASVFSFFNIRYLMLHSAGGALRYTDLLDVAAAAADGARPERLTLVQTFVDARSASRLQRAMTPADPPPSGSVLVYKVAPPADPLPFLGIGAGWSPVMETPEGVMRAIEHEAELLIYSAQPRTLVLDLDLLSPGVGQLNVSVDRRLSQTLDLRGGAQRHRMTLTIASGVTHLWLKPEVTGPLAVRSVGIVGDRNPPDGVDRGRPVAETD